MLTGEKSNNSNFYLLETVLVHCKQLKSITLTQFNEANDADMLRLFTIPNSLTRLQISNHRTLSTDTMIVILEENKQLSHVIIDYCFKVSVRFSYFYNNLNWSGRNIDCQLNNSYVKTQGRDCAKLVVL